MNIFDLTKQIKHGQWYKVPNDIYGHASTDVDGKEAVKICTYLRNYWARQHMPTEFEIGKTVEVRIWDPLERKHVNKNVTRITIMNDAIKNFKPGK